MIHTDPSRWLAEARRTLPPTIITKEHAEILIRDSPESLLGATPDSFRCDVEAARLLLEFFQAHAPNRSCMLATEGFMKHPGLAHFMSEFPRLFADPVTRNQTMPISRLAKRLAYHRLTGLSADTESLFSDLAEARLKYPKLRLGFFEEKINNLENS
jgi:hypothetical protein